MVTIRSIRAKAGSKPTTMLTAYDALTANVVDEAGIDIALVGDNMGGTALGYDSTLPVIVEDVASRVAAVAHATDNALVVTDMPFLSVGVDKTPNVKHCGRMLKETDADAVKLEYGPHTVELTECPVRLGVLVMAHLGLTPRRIKEVDYGRQGTDRDDAQEIPDLAKTHAEASAFSLVFEHVPVNFAEQVTKAIDTPTTGTGAGPDCGGRMLIVDDVIGMGDRTPPFATQFGDVKSEVEKAVGAYRNAVEAGEFPADEHSHVEDDLDELYWARDPEIHARVRLRRPMPRGG